MVQDRVMADQYKVVCDLSNVAFLMTLNDPTKIWSNFKGTRLFDVEYQRNGTETHDILNGILSNDIEWYHVRYQDFQRHRASRGLSATAELLVFCFVSNETKTSQCRPNSLTGAAALRSLMATVAAPRCQSDQCPISTCFRRQTNKPTDGQYHHI